MKSRFIVLISVVLLFIGPHVFAETKPKLDTEKDKLSYSLGLSIGQSFVDQEIVVEPSVLLKGIEDALNKREPLLSTEEIKATMELFQRRMTQKMKQKTEERAEVNLKVGEAFLLENGKKEGITTTASGLQYQVIRAGSGQTPTIEDTVVTNYEGTLINGTVFDSSYKRGKTVTFPVNGVIRGWTEALLLMKTGAKWKLYIPARLAYGERGAGNVIGPNETLIFDIELLEVK